MSAPDVIDDIRAENRKIGGLNVVIDLRAELMKTPLGTKLSTFEIYDIIKKIEEKYGLYK